MFLNGLIERRLASLLRPWLRDEPELEFRLGFLRSHAILRNPDLDASALNRLLDDDTPFCFRQVTVEKLSIQVANWSAPAFHFQLHGVRIVLSLGELKEEKGGRGTRKRRDTSVEDRRKSLAELDPEGSALHDTIEWISEISPPSWSSSLCNSILRHCRLQMNDALVVLEASSSNDLFSSSLGVKNLGTEPQFIGHGCFISGLISSIFDTFAECSFLLDMKGLEVGLKSKNHLSFVVPSTDILTSINLKNLQLVKCNVSVTSIEFSLSPEDLSIIILFHILSSKKSTHGRSGRELWKIAASRMSSLIATPKLSLHKVVAALRLWLKYMHLYKDLLLQVGYPVDSIMEKSAYTMSQDKVYSRSLMRQWQLLSEIEVDLPAQAIALAWQITRHRAASTARKVKGCDGPLLNIANQKICWLLSVVSSISRSILNSVKCYFFPQQVFSDCTPLGSFSQWFICLNVGELSISFSLEYGVQALGSGIQDSDFGLSSQDFHSFKLSTDALCIEYSRSVSQRCFGFAAGCVKGVSSSSLSGVPNNSSSYLNRLKKSKIQNRQTTLWGDPVQNFLVETTGAGPAGPSKDNGKASVFQELLTGKTWLNWKNSCSRYERDERQKSQNPFIICEIKIFLTGQIPEQFTCGFLDCRMVVGRLNLLLEDFSVITLASLYRIMDALYKCSIGASSNVDLPASGNLENLRIIDWNTTFNSYSNVVELAMLRLLPEKHIKMGVHITGPHILLSLANKGFYCENTDKSNRFSNDKLQLSFDFHDIEFAVSPKVASDFASSSADSAAFEPHVNSLRLKEPQNIGSSKLNEEIFCPVSLSVSALLKFTGLKISFYGLSETPMYRILELFPVDVQYSFLRKDDHSLGSMCRFISAALVLRATGFTTLLFLDDLTVLVKVLSCLLSAVSHSLDDFNWNGGLCYHTIMKQAKPFSLTENDIILKSRPRHESSISMSISFVLHSSFELKSVDAVLLESRRRYAENQGMQINIGPSDTKLDLHEVSEHGIYIHVQRSLVELSVEGPKMEFLTDLSGFQFVIFKWEIAAGKNYLLELENLLPSLDSLYKIGSFFSRLSFHLCSSIRQNAMSSTGLKDAAQASTSVPLCSSVENVSNILLSQSHAAQWLFIDISVSGIYLVGSSVKNILAREGISNGLDASFAAGEKFKSISFRSQGGSVFLETEAVVKFVQCIALYYHSIANLWPAPPSYKESMEFQYENAATSANQPSEDIPQFHPAKWNQLETFDMNLSQISVLMMAIDESGRLQKLLVEADIHLNLKMLPSPRKVSFAIPRLSILSQLCYQTMDQKARDIEVSSVISNDLSPISDDGDHWNCSNPDGPSKRFSGESSEGFRLDHMNTNSFILKESSVSLAAEWVVNNDGIGPVYPNEIWVGNGSILGLDLTVSLRELLMILFAIDSLSGVFSKETIGDGREGYWSRDQEYEGSSEEMVPDGAIVAIQDVCQHMYIAVDGAESGFNVAGTIHYSLVGERALFRVKYHNPRWKSKVQYFSLISLCAKDDSGEPLRLNCRPRSSFVDISCSVDNSWSLWKIYPCKSEDYEGDVEWESWQPPAKNVFHLVNKKNDYAVAFVDGVLETVNKPGSPFKLKIFNDPSPANNTLLPDRYSTETSMSTEQHNLHVNNKTELRKSTCLSGVTVAVEKIMLTIVYELPNTKDKFPLLRGSIDTNELFVHILNSKARVVSKLTSSLLYFDAQRNLWQEFIHPLELCIFYRYNFPTPGLENVVHGVPGHFYARFKELRMSVTELSLDIMLFVIGKLDLAGPYALRSSRILANCCKVRNQTGLTLLYHFYDNHDAAIAAKQSTTIFLRHLASTDQPPETRFFSICLSNQKFLSTSSIRVSLSETQLFAWRTRLLSSKDSKSSPGPFVVVEVSQRTEDDLTVVVSPLLRIHNKTDFSMELRFQRPQQQEEYASLMLRPGDSIDDSMAAFEAINLSGGEKKALASLSIGNFSFSFRPRITDELSNLENSTVEWSDDLRGGKPVRLSGIFDKLSYQVRKAFSIDPVKYSLSSSTCFLKSENGGTSRIHFLIQSLRKDIPILRPDNFGHDSTSMNAPVALQEQKEIFLLPTVHITNLLHTEIHVELADTDSQATVLRENLLSQATVPSGSSVNLYADPSTIYVIVTLAVFGSTCKPVNTSEWVKKLQNQRNINHLDIELNFGGGKYCALLRLSRGLNGLLEAAVFTTYTLENDTNFSLACFAANQKSVSRDETKEHDSRIPPELGSHFPAKSTISWFIKCHKVCLQLLEEKACEALLDLDALSGLTEIDLESEKMFGLKNITRLGVALRPYISDVAPSQIVSIKPRYIVVNETEEVVTVRQFYFEEEMDGLISINSRQRKALRLQMGMRRRREASIFENFLRKHTKDQDDSYLFIQFQLNEYGLGWSGPVCITSLGRFFLKFRRSLEFPVKKSDEVTQRKSNLFEFAVVHVVEEGSTIFLHFQRTPSVKLPYRIENFLHNAAITYYQKGSLEAETLGSGSTVNYVWDNTTLPHKLVVQIYDVHILREVNLDKVRGWKPFYRAKQHRGLGSLLPVKKPEDQERAALGQIIGTEMVKLGYEVYADGLKRVLRICEFGDRRKEDTLPHSSTKMQLRISYLAIQFLEHAKQGTSMADSLSIYSPIITARLENVDMDSFFTNQHKFNQIRVQSVNVDQKWVGAPFATMLRRHELPYGDAKDNILRVLLVLRSSSSTVKVIRYLSIVLKPLDLKLDEETLMRIVPFWRTSLSDPTSPSRQYYFDHFEIHPIKIVASFSPADLSSNYSSTQEMLRSLLHSVIKIPAVKSMNIELNGVLVTHALLTARELSVKCAQHYSWYAMRAIYVAKGSPLLPPAFASIFDDLASSSLDVFFDPSSGLINLPGISLGTFKFIRKCIYDKGFSGTKRYFGDLGKTLKLAGSNILFAAVTEISDSVLKGAEASGFNGLVSGFHQGILRLAMEPSVLGSAFIEGGPDRKIMLDHSPGVDELYIEGYLQAMLDTIYKQEYLRVRVVDNQVILKNLPPSSSLIDEIIERVKSFLVSKGLLKGDPSVASRSLRHIRGENDWRIGPTVLTLCEHLLVSFTIRALRKQSRSLFYRVKWKEKLQGDDKKAIVPGSAGEVKQVKLAWKWGVGKFVLSSIVAYVDGRLCRRIPHPLARRIVSGFLLSFLDNNDDK